MDQHRRLEQLANQLRQQVEELANEVARLSQAGLVGDAEVDAAAPDEALAADAAEDEEHVRFIRPTQTDDPSSIIGGLPTNDFPDCCAVGNAAGYFCSGTLIAPNVVVTARHCTRVSQVFLRGGDISNSDGAEVLRVVRNIAHPSADIRVLVLEDASEVTPRHIAQGKEVKGKEATLVGFGNVDPEGEVGYGVKRRVNKIPIQTLLCELEDHDAVGCHVGTEMVAGHRGLKADSCTGDSGGPLYVSSDEGGFYLLGATSRGTINTDVDCGDGGIYVRLDRYVNWIRSVTGVKIEGPRP